MRIVIDLQAAQGTNTRRGIGRYSLALARAMIRRAGPHEIILALNGSLPDSIEPIRAACEGILDQAHIRVWQGLTAVAGNAPAQRWRRLAGEQLRETFLASLQPDVVHIASLFEGFVDDALTSIGAAPLHVPTASTLYDLIPFIYRDAYLREPAVAHWYDDKLGYLKDADQILTISEASRRDAIDLLHIPPDRITNISAAVDERFKPVAITPAAEAQLRRRLGLRQPFVMYTGGIDYRKNVEGLIRGFARLPKPLRQTHQLAIVCAISDTERDRLDQLAQRYGLHRGTVIFTGFVSDDDLVLLYNLTEIFCFPSLYEGFGLPVLEAMACGAAAIAADTSSLPEVVGRADALFRPSDDEAIAERLGQVLADDGLRAALRAYGLKRAAEFSWDTSAARALDALQACISRAPRADRVRPGTGAKARPRLVYVSPMPPDQSGIADYSVELLRELTAYYAIDVVVPQDAARYEQSGNDWTIRTLDWFYSRPRSGERILYQFGNSPFHAHMFAMLERNPGVVVLHDFFLGNLIAHREEFMKATNAWSEALYQSHGYRGLAERFTNPDAGAAVRKYPANLAVLRLALGVIVHSEYARQLAAHWFGEALLPHLVALPQPHAPVERIDRAAARQQLGLGADSFVVCSFGMLAPPKNHHRLLEAWLASQLASDPACQLFFVGDSPPTEFSRALTARIDAAGLAERIKITGFVTPAAYANYLAAADVAVQLRAESRGETSRAVLDCMSYGLPVIVNRHGTMTEFPADAVVSVNDPFTEAELAAALEATRVDQAKRVALGQRGRATIAETHAAPVVAARYCKTIEAFYLKAERGRGGLIASLARPTETTPDDHDLRDAALAIAQSLPLPAPPRQLLLDISELVQRDSGTGIQRVVRNVLQVLLDSPPAGYRVEPIYATPTAGYRYARRFTLRFLGCPESALTDEPIELGAGDIFLALDLQAEVAKAHPGVLARMRDCGVKTYFVVYDLLWTQMPQYFVRGATDLLDPWLRAVAASDGAVCISKTVADEVYDYLSSNPPRRLRPLRIGWFHLGSEPLTATSHPKPHTEAHTGELAGAAPFMLMVGTIEPRKGYAQALDAFEDLWRRGINLDLVMIGKQGWMVDGLVERIREHPELDRRLFWHPRASDETLEAAYQAARGLLMASEGEGFGLPLIEASRHGCPILARDLPVFREVAQAHATYFTASNGIELADALVDWYAALREGRTPRSTGIPFLTWRQSTEQLIEVILGDRWYRTFDPRQGTAPPG